LEAVLADTNQSGCLTVGEGVVLNGTFVVPDIASISGSIEGEITARELIVSSTGVIRGKVTADIIDLRGEIHDTLTAKKSLFIRSTGKALGSVQYAEIEIEKGGDLQGALQKIDGETPSSSGSY
jgi:cytoskeletal protein CcmA (bactofilin family)